MANKFISKSFPYFGCALCPIINNIFIISMHFYLFDIHRHVFEDNTVFTEYGVFGSFF